MIDTTRLTQSRRFPPKCCLASSFSSALLVGASGFVSPPVALAMGLLFRPGVARIPTAARPRKKFSKFLLQASVVGLGFGMNLHQVVRAGRSGFVYTMLGISFALLAGMGLARC